MQEKKPIWSQIKCNIPQGEMQQILDSFYTSP